jgi:hypothetical protein
VRKQDNSRYEDDNRDEDEEQGPRLVRADFVVEDEGIEKTMGKYISSISDLGKDMRTLLRCIRRRTPGQRELIRKPSDRDSGKQSA